ncbi:hypothetical protein FOL47_000067 [Perkinsus chesapeaki]|uniref:Uncharacterized protein n=1 Tax=Perkinsus chesapeaki TaxID=330153 RepID=A0A7J6N341_PERCH|nr:hypothetical protein FOL47_000067 [Perkinsus chesapeaki]
MPIDHHPHLALFQTPRRAATWRFITSTYIKKCETATLMKCLLAWRTAVLVGRIARMTSGYQREVADLADEFTSASYQHSCICAHALASARLRTMRRSFIVAWLNYVNKKRLTRQVRRKWFMLIAASANRLTKLALLRWKAVVVCRRHRARRVCAILASLGRSRLASAFGDLKVAAFSDGRGTASYSNVKSFSLVTSSQATPSTMTPKSRGYPRENVFPISVHSTGLHADLDLLTVEEDQESEMWPRATPEARSLREFESSPSVSRSLDDSFEQVSMARMARDLETLKCTVNQMQLKCEEVTQRLPPKVPQIDFKLAPCMSQSQKIPRGPPPTGMARRQQLYTSANATSFAYSGNTTPTVVPSTATSSETPSRPKLTRANVHAQSQPVLQTIPQGSAAFSGSYNEFSPMNFNLGRMSPLPQRQSTWTPIPARSSSVQPLQRPNAHVAFRVVLEARTDDAGFPLFG